MLYQLQHQDDTLSPGDSLTFLIECPPAAELKDLAPSAYVEVRSFKHCTVQLFEAPRIASAGTELHPACDDEDAPALCPVQTFSGPDVDDDGQLSARGFSRWGAFRHGFWPLKPATQYLLRVTNAADAPTFVITSVYIALRSPEQP
jgi:hypothetical protein